MDFFDFFCHKTGKTFKTQSKKRAKAPNRDAIATSPFGDMKAYISFKFNSIRKDASGKEPVGDFPFHKSFACFVGFVINYFLMLKITPKATPRKAANST